MKSDSRSLFTVTLILLIGVLLRWSVIAELSQLLNYDEAYYGVDALSLMEHPRLTPFLPDNYGRESLWCYILIPFLAIWKAHLFTLRLAAAIRGALTLAVMYRFSAEVVNRKAAVWATLALALSQWHIHQSRIALRAPLFPLMGILTLWAVLRALRTGQYSWWIFGGIGLGLMMYTYFSSIFWIFLSLVLLGILAITQRRQQIGPLISLGIALLLFLPMVLYGLSHPQEIFQRPAVVRISSLSEFWGNLQLWAKAWFGEGNPDLRYNPFSRPVVDPYLSPFFVAGLISIWWTVRRRWFLLLIAGLVLFSLLPSLLSHHAPHFLRASGLVIPVAVIVGAGISGIERWLRWIVGNRAATGTLLIFFAFVGWATWQEVNVRWLQHPGIFAAMEQHINHSINFIRKTAPPDEMVYFSPFTLSHPVIVFRRADLAPRPTGAFAAHICIVIPERPATYASILLYEPDFPQMLSRWAEITLLFQEPNIYPPRYAVFRAVPKSEFLDQSRWPSARFGEMIEVRLLDSLSLTAHPGDEISFQLGLRALRPLDKMYSVFVHLYGTPPPWEGGRLWAQGDSLVCEPYPSILWKPEEWVLQTFRLSLPADIPQGKYQIAIGVYEAPAGARLPLEAEKKERDDQDYWPIHTLEVAP